MNLSGRLRSKTRQTDTCWLWEGATRPNGYGVIWRDGRFDSPHRVAYELSVGPIPDGWQIDHLCKTRNCVNPAHLEAVTQRENLLRGNTVAAASLAKTHCPQGHAYDERNTVFDRRGWRRCRTCKAARRKAPRVVTPCVEVDVDGKPVWEQVSA